MRRGGKKEANKRGRRRWTSGQTGRGSQCHPQRPHANPARKWGTGLPSVPWPPELVLLLFTGKSGRGRVSIAGLSLPPGLSCQKLRVIREQGASHWRWKWASCCRAKDSWEPTEASSGQVASSGNRVERSVNPGKTAGRNQGRGHCGSHGEGRWGLDQTGGWGWREGKKSGLLSSR